MRSDRVLGTLERVRVPTIAAIAGACTGGGAGIAACCRTLSREEGRDLILRAYMSEDFREGMDAYLNKRTPNWKGQ